MHELLLALAKNFQWIQYSSKQIRESGTEIGHSLEFDFVVPPPQS